MTCRDGFGPNSLHMNASLAKSYMGVIAATLATKMFSAAPPRGASYVPQLRGTAYVDAHIDDLLHMTTPVAYGGRSYDRLVETQLFHQVVRPVDRPLGYTDPMTVLE